MTIKVQAFLPGCPNPLSLDDYVDLTTMIAASGIADKAVLLPDYLSYNNPTTGNKCTIELA